MVFDRTEHEPEEYDPEAEFRDPDSDSLTIPDVSRETEKPTPDSPSVAIPEVTVDETDVPGELLEQFWALVLVLNVAIFAAALGFLFVVFGRNTTHSIVLLAGAGILFGFAYRRYRAYEALDIDDERSESTDEAGSENETDTDSETRDFDSGGDDTKTRVADDTTISDEGEGSN